MVKLLARIMLLPGLAVIACGAGAAAGDVDPEVVEAIRKESALIIFTVSHDAGPPFALLGMKTSSFGAAANVKLNVEFRGPALEGGKLLVESRQPVHGNTSAFEDRFGKLFVREVPPGRYELFTWELVQLVTPTSPRTVRPPVPPPAQPFEVTAGSVTYLGNIHGELTWERSLLGMHLMDDGRASIRNEAERDLELAYRTYPQLRGKVTVAPLKTGAWTAE